MWGEQVLAQLGQEYRRIGIREGERLPTPAFGDDAERFLAMLRRIPDGAGIQGYLQALAAEAR